MRQFPHGRNLDLDLSLRVPRGAQPPVLTGPCCYTGDMSDANLILITGGLLIAGLLATVVAGRLRVPGLLLFLGLGMAVGSDGLGWIDFSDYELARTIGVIALALILFEGGLSAGFGEVRPVLGASIGLAIPEPW